MKKFLILLVKLILAIGYSWIVLSIGASGSAITSILIPVIGILFIIDGIIGIFTIGPIGGIIMIAIGVFLAKVDMGDIFNTIMPYVSGAVYIISAIFLIAFAENHKTKATRILAFIFPLFYIASGVGFFIKNSTVMNLAVIGSVIWVIVLIVDYAIDRNRSKVYY